MSGRGTPTKVVLLVALTVAVAFLRRPDQFLAPHLWAEDGNVILLAYAERGLASIVEPVAGYHVLATKLATLTALKASLMWAPEIAATLAVAVTCAVVVAIATSPTLLPWRYLCAVAALLVPTAPETFTVSLFAFWWAGLLLPLALLWDTGRGMAPLRIAFVVIGGLSSPLIVPFAALLALRAGVERTRGEYILAGIALAIAALQFATLKHTGAVASGAAPGLSDAAVAVNTFAGPFITGPRHWFSEDNPGFIVLALMAAAAFFARARLPWHVALLALAWCAVCAATLLRLDIVGLDPVHAGPRYFFYPFILLSWLGIWIAAMSPLAVRAAFAGGFALALASAGPHLSRRHDPLNWRDHIAACARSERYDLPLHSSGRLANIWHVQLTGAQCRAMVAGSVFDQVP